MKLNTYRLIVVMCGLVAMSMIVASNAHAQVDEAMGTNWDNAGRLSKLIVDAFEAGKQEEVYKLTDEFRANLDYVQNKVERVGQRLHDKDKNWPWAAKRDTAVQATQQARVAAGLLGSTVKGEGLVKAASAYRDFKDRWAAFVEMMNALRIEFMSHGSELNNILKAFREECPKCVS